MGRKVHRPAEIGAGPGKNEFTKPYGRVTSETPIRVTSCQLLEECPRQWEARHLRGEGQGRRSQASEIGTWVHEALEHLMLGRWSPGTEAEATVMSRLQDLGMTARELKSLGEYARWLVPHRAQVAAVEHEFTLRLVPDAPPVRGHIDLVLTSPGLTVVVDHKTNRRRDPLSVWRARLQPMMYAWAARYLWRQPVVDVVIGYVNLAKTVRWRTMPADDQALIERYRQLWSRLQRWQASGSWPATLNDGCRWCPISDSCSELKNQGNRFIQSLRLGDPS